MRKILLAAMVVASIACGTDSTDADSTRHFYLYTWQGQGTYVMGDRVVAFGNYIEIDSGKLDLTAAGRVDESIWYKYAVPSTAPIVTASEHFVGRWTNSVDGNQEIHLPLPGDADATVGYVQADQSAPVFRSWERSGASFGGNFLYLKR